MRQFFVPTLTSIAVLLALGACGGSSGGGTPVPPTQQPTTSTAATVSGLVASQAGTGLPGATVEIGSGAAAKTATTNEQGFFAINDVAPGQHMVRYSHDGYVQNTKRVQVTASQNTQVSVNLQAIGTTQTIDARQAQTVTSPCR